MKKAVLALLGFLMPLVLLFGCQQSSSSTVIHPSYSGTEEKLTYTTGDAFVSTYTSGKNFSEAGVAVYFEGIEIPIGGFFYTTDASAPESNILTSSRRLTTTESTVIFTYYAAYTDGTLVYVTKPITVTVTQEQTNSWLEFTVMGIVMGFIIIMFGVVYSVQKKHRGGK
jgi:hypothetical protein